MGVLQRTSDVKRVLEPLSQLPGTSHVESGRQRQLEDHLQSNPHQHLQWEHRGVPEPGLEDRLWSPLSLR